MFILESDGSYGLNEIAERMTVNYLMQGYILADIADHFGKTRQSLEILFKRAVKKIVKRNNSDWEECTGARIDDE